MARTEDQVMYLFRERIKAQDSCDRKVDAEVNRPLTRALDRAWRAKSVEFRLTMARNPGKAVPRFEAFFGKLPCSYDQGAFSFLLSSLPEELTSLAQLAPQARAAVVALGNRSAVMDYVRKMAGTADFFKARPGWLIQLGLVGDKLEGLLDQLQSAFSLEDLIMAVQWLHAHQLLPAGANASGLAQRLTERLVRQVRDGLSADLAIGLEPDEVVAIERVTDPDGVLIKQALYRGRIRRFVKQYQNVFTRNQLAWLEPARGGILAAISELKKAEKNPRSVEALGAMEKNLADIRRFMEVKTGLVKVIHEAVIAVFRNIGTMLKHVDPDNQLLQ
jgi:hypothetical protein